MLQFSSTFARGNEPDGKFVWWMLLFNFRSRFLDRYWETLIERFDRNSRIRWFVKRENKKKSRNRFLKITPYIFLIYFDRTFPFFFFEKVFKSKLQTRNSPSSNEDERFAQVLPFVNYPRTRMKPEKVVSTRFPDNSGRGWLIIVSRDVNR